MIFSRAKRLPKIKTIITDSENQFDYMSSKAIDIQFLNAKNNEVIGHASISAIDTSFPFLYNFEINPRYRGKGYGHAAMKYMIDIHHLYSLCVNLDNTKAIKLYEEFGFIRTSISYNNENLIYMTRVSLR